MSHFAPNTSTHSHAHRSIQPLLTQGAGAGHHHHHSGLEAHQDEEEEVVASSEHHRTVDEQNHAEVMHAPDARALHDVQAFYVEHLAPGGASQHGELGALEEPGDQSGEDGAKADSDAGTHDADEGHAASAHSHHQHAHQHQHQHSHPHQQHAHSHGSGEHGHGHHAAASSEHGHGAQSEAARQLAAGVAAPLSANPQLREREEILRQCYKTWFRVKPGAREVKDRFWALYYRRLQPKYVMRDNLVGRKISEWISDDLDMLVASDPTKAAQLAHIDETPKPGPKPKVDPEKGPNRRRSTGGKEGGYAAYLHVELVSPTGADLAYAHKALQPYLTDPTTPIEFTRDALEDDVGWFRANRDAIMRAIPAVGQRRQRARSSSPTRGGAAALLPGTAPAPAAAKKTKLQHVHENITISHNPDPPMADSAAPAPLTSAAPAGPRKVTGAGGVEVECDKDWLRCDVQRSSQADGTEVLVVRVDLPGMLPGESDLHVQTDGNKLLVKGDRHAAVPPEQLLHSGRPSGAFSLLVTLPFVADSNAKSEQTYSYGVLTVKIPIPHPSGWRSLDVLNLGT